MNGYSSIRCTAMNDIHITGAAIYFLKKVKFFLHDSGGSHSTCQLSCPAFYPLRPPPQPEIHGSQIENIPQMTVQSRRSYCIAANNALYTAPRIGISNQIQVNCHNFLPSYD
jgi:hypothetical protein